MFILQHSSNMVTFMIITVCSLVASLLPCHADITGPHLVSGFRPPSVPLIVVDPYLSIWSNADHLYDDFPKHWSGSVVCLSGMISIDGKVYRFMAKDYDLAPDVMTQVNLTVYPTQTVYVFEEAGVRLTLTFTTPAIATPNEYPTLPITHLTYTVQAIDSATHNVRLYYDNTAEGVVSTTNELVTWDNAPLMPGQVAMKIGTVAQDYLGQGSDRINWGYWYVNTVLEKSVQTTMAYSTDARTAFMQGKDLPQEDTNKPRACNDKWPVLVVMWDIGSVGSSPVDRILQITYDQVYSIKYFGTPMIPLWKHIHANFSGLIRATDYYDIKKACDNMDATVIDALYSVGGAEYATISSLAWRQAMGGTIAVWNNITGEPWMFLKEISSDGDVSTVDVLFPASPVFIWSSPEALKLMLLPLLEYANNGTSKYGTYIPYNLQWAPHHLGHWPVCDLQPSHQEQMPVEESGNMLLMIAGIVYKTKDATFLSPYWDLLKIWADFIVASLPDPGNQLCTDDFEGPSPHNMNLAAKGMVALGAYSQLLTMKGDTNSSAYYSKLNAQFIQYWTSKGLSSDHYRRQYDLADSWSLKYNLLFQKILHIDSLFPDTVFEQELTYYMTKMNKYGIPMDDRHLYTKTDWLMWIAAIANNEQFQAISSAVYKFANETPDRSPFTDWYAVDTGNRRGFTARPVIGGLFAKLLT